jgi:phage repressor protein C with HTH and peptisase S24 domain
MDKYEKRRLKLIWLRDNRCNGKASALAEVIKRDPSYVSRMLYPEGKAGKKRIADDMIEVIEDGFKLARGWMDSIGDTATQINAYDNGQIKDKEEGVLIRKYDTGGAMGNGMILEDQPGVIESWRVSQEWLDKNVRSHSGVSNLVVVTGFGDSMKGMFNPGDPLLVDMGVNNIDHDGVFFFRVDDKGFIKRLQRIPGQGIVVISENSAYRDWTITPDMSFSVIGKVLKVWESTDF